MKRIFLVICLAVCAIRGFGVVVDLPELPKTPVSQLGMGPLSEALSTNSAESWNTIATSSRDKAIELAQSGNIEQASNWLYTSLAASLCAKEAVDMPVELKRIILENIPAFFDFYESATEYDSLSNACSILTQIFLNQPAQVKKYLRAAMALGLIYDTALPANWPKCNVASEPTQVSMPQEIFLYFSLKAEKLPFDLNRLTIGELVWVMGIPGPLTELETVFTENMKLREIENVYSSIKTDTSRVRGSKSKDWDLEKVDFTLANIKEKGATPYEKVYYAWRLANANGVPCMFFNDSIRSASYAWLAYMNGVNEWKFNVFREQASKSLFGYPINPQTWRPISSFELNKLAKRDIVSPSAMKSIVLTRLAVLLSDIGKYRMARDFAKQAIDTNPENWQAYRVYIPSMARCGAESKELDVAFKNSYEVFKKYPEQSVKMLNLYRANLIARKRAKEADILFANAMKPIMRVNPALVAVLYGDVWEEMLSRAKTSTEALSIFRGIMRNASRAPEQFYEYVGNPVIEYFWNKNDRKAAYEAIKIVASSSRSSDKVKDSLKSLKEKFDDEVKSEKEDPNNTSGRKKEKYMEN